MSRITGSEVYSMMEAYQGVYNPDIRLELEEEIILQENADIWVVECIDEGIDLSEYTLDELTEAFLIDCGYLSEDATGRLGQNIGAGARQIFGQARRAVGSAVSNVAKGVVNTAGAAAQGLAGQKGGTGPISRTANTLTRAYTAPARLAARAAQGFVTGQGSSAAKPAAKPAAPSGTTSKFAGARDAAFNKAKAIKGSPVVGPAKPAASSSSASASRPAATSRPSAAPSARPAATAKPAPTAAAKPVTQPPESKSQASAGEIRGMIGRSMERQAASTPAAAKPSPTSSATGSKKPGSIVSGFDMFDVVKGHLIGEGYDLSDYTWEDMYEAYIDEAKKDEDEKEYAGYGKSSKFKQDTDKDSFKPGTTVPTVKTYGRISRFTPHGIGAHRTKRDSDVTKITGGDPGEARAKKIATTTKLVKTKTGWKKVQAESLDTYDIVLMHLLDEGYASHPDAAEAIMVNMSEQWIESIVG